MCLSCFQLLLRCHRLTLMKTLTGFLITVWLCNMLIPPQFHIRIVKLSSEMSEVLTFQDYNNNEARTFHTVCLTTNKAKVKYPKRCSPFWYTKRGKLGMPCRHIRLPQKVITAYYNSSKDFPDLDVLKKGTIPLLGFKIIFKSISELPSDHVVMENQTAYFLGPNAYPDEPDNFFHFTKQIYFPLYWLIKSTNQLHANADNVVFYRGPYGLWDNKYIYYNITKFQYFRDILHVTSKLELSAHMDWPHPNKICYRNAVFSNKFFLSKALEAISYFKSTLNIVDNVCKTNILTIIDRKSYRRISNIEELKKVATEMGYDTRAVAMETLTLQEQTQLVHCTNVLVGVTGAGLQWAFFMRNYSGVVEIAWPDKEWPFFFTGTGAYQSEERDVIRPLNFTQLRGKCQLNPSAINIYTKDIYRRVTNISHEVALEILQNKKNYGFMAQQVMSAGKLCDVIIDPQDFRNAVLSVRRKKS